MSSPIGTVLLIDDDEADNYLHRRVIDRAGMADQVVVHESATAALEWLGTPIDGAYPAPDLIFLDINMPGMNGWEFLDAYEQLPEEQRGRIVLVMLTASVNPAGEERAASFETVTGYRSKPLTEQMLLDIIDEFFPTA